MKLGDTANFNVEYSNDYPWDDDPRPILPSPNSYKDSSPEGLNETA